MLPGIDVSHYQGSVDWNRVKLAGIQFAYLKATQGASFVDPRLMLNVAGCRAVGIPFGLYHVFLANTGQAQIDNWTKRRDLCSPDLPSWLDIEPGALTEETAPQALEMMRTGFTMKDCVYCSPSTADQWLTDVGFDLYGLAIAHYGVSEPRIGGAWDTRKAIWDFWQHSAVGTVDGIDGPVDLDWFNEDIGTLQSIMQPTNFSRPRPITIPQRAGTPSQHKAQESPVT